jgi:hypothetical protein
MSERIEPLFNLDDTDAVLYALRDMSQAGGRAHTAASQDDGRTGVVRDLIFGLNTTVDALIEMIEQ